VLLTTFICIIIKKKNYRISNGTNEDSLIPWVDIYINLIKIK
jgi:hypothetical protein